MLTVKLNISEAILIIIALFLIHIASSHAFIGDKLWYNNICPVKTAASDLPVLVDEEEKHWVGTVLAFWRIFFWSTPKIECLRTQVNFIFSLFCFLKWRRGRNYTNLLDYMDLKQHCTLSSNELFKTLSRAVFVIILA